ncbi:MAG: hypothetical protein PQJ59_01800 [Spirochaetales bacterium]|nr:hypothetical protein [Spirochaetales bacterium]
MSADFDTLFTALKTALEEYSADQETAYKFDVYKDYFRALPNNGHAAVFLYLGPMNPEEETGVYAEYETDYVFDLVCWGKKTGNTRGDEAAAARLRYLIDQVLNALYDPDNMTFGLEAGTFKRGGFPRVEQLDVPQAGERVAAAARMTLTLSTAWQPDEQTGTAMDQIYVTADKWAALLEPVEEDEE